MSVQPDIRFVEPADGPGLVEPILRSVPEWFGIETSTMAYVAAAGRLPTLVASLEGRPAGFITLERHFPESAEMHCLAVHKAEHGRGVGTAMVRFAETWLRGQGVRMLQVKTQGPSKPNAGYARTLRFYVKMGFVPLEEFKGLWAGIPCLVLVKSVS